jgi:hypothetical protein
VASAGDETRAALSLIMVRALVGPRPVYSEISRTGG